MVSKQEAYDKVVRTIKSCVTYEQIRCAKKMADNYIKMYYNNPYEFIKLSELFHNRISHVAIERLERIFK